MAKVFLSYDHGDGARVASIADALEKAGHSVWWDRHIHGGAEYSCEIESAVEQSEAVIVFWSERSVKSAWVRDEAAEGRDQGKLIPVRIDAVKPPMGFRQYQTIDMFGREKRGAHAALGRLIGAIEAVSGPNPQPTVKPRPTPLQKWPISPTIGAGFGLVLLAVIAFLWRPWETPDSGFSVSVVAGDHSSESSSLAGNLLIQLGSLQASGADVLDLVEPGSSAQADLIFKVIDVGITPEPHASLSLVDNRVNILLWSREFVQPRGSPADLRQQVAYSVGQVLRCTTEALAPTHRKLELPTLKLYLNGCSDLSNVLADGAGASIPIFRKVVEQAPTFAGGWAKLILAEMWAFRDTAFGDATLRTDLRAHIDYARKNHPGMAEPALAEAWLQTAD